MYRIGGDYMTKKSKKRKASKYKIRIFLALLVFGMVTAGLGYNLFNNVISIVKMSNEKKELKNQIAVLAKEKENLELDIQRLNDPDYIAKYVREKYFYSKEGELILRMDK